VTEVTKYVGRRERKEVVEPFSTLNTCITNFCGIKHNNVLQSATQSIFEKCLQLKLKWKMCFHVIFQYAMAMFNLVRFSKIKLEKGFMILIYDDLCFVKILKS